MGIDIHYEMTFLIALCEALKTHDAFSRGVLPV